MTRLGKADLVWQSTAEAKQGFVPFWHSCAWSAMAISDGGDNVRIFDVYSKINDCFIGWTYAETAAKAVNNVRFRVYGKMESNRNFYAVERK